MTIKEGILKSLEDLKQPSNSNQISAHLLKEGYATFTGKTPIQTVYAQLSDLIRLGDARIKRYKSQKDGTYFYYLTKDEQSLSIDLLTNSSTVNETEKSISERKTYDERDLHILLSSYLNSIEIFSKTIFHEKSLNSKDANQKWVHPDLVGISLSNLKTTTAKALMRSINKEESVILYSYELKKEINTDYDLKQAFFQTVSNSRWANYGFLVALEISDNLIDELERLCESFGIGVILLSSYPYESKVLIPSQFKQLDFRTIDKLCVLNKEFKKFIELTENILSAEEKFQAATQKELFEFCDECFTDDNQILEYCKTKSIPMEKQIDLLDLWDKMQIIN